MPCWLELLTDYNISSPREDSMNTQNKGFAGIMTEFQLQMPCWVIDRLVVKQIIDSKINSMTLFIVARCYASADNVVMRCPCVCLSVCSWIVETVSANFFCHRVAKPFYTVSPKKGTDSIGTNHPVWLKNCKIMRETDQVPAGATHNHGRPWIVCMTASSTLRRRQQNIIELYILVNIKPK